MCTCFNFVFFVFFQRYLSLSLLFKCGYIFLTKCNIMFGLTYSVPFYWTSSGLLNVYCTFNLIKIFYMLKSPENSDFFISEFARNCEKVLACFIGWFIWTSFCKIAHDHLRIVRRQMGRNFLSLDPWSHNLSLC